ALLAVSPGASCFATSATPPMLCLLSLHDALPISMNQVVNANLDDPEWSSTKIDDYHATVYIEGYMPYYGENVRLEFAYEELDESTISGSLERIVFLDSMEAYSNDIASALFLQQMYENT